jgi:uncharacterized protein YutE (UPF0331/DUF86 family)
MAQLAEYHNDLEGIRKMPELTIQQFVQDKMIRRFVERTLHLAIECCIDIGSHIIADEGFRAPTANREIFSILAENKVISDESDLILQKMAQFRNLLVHDYARIDPNIIFQILNNNLCDIQNFYRQIKDNYYL